MTITLGDHRLIEAAENALKNAYAPYSQFRVGAAVRTESGNVYSGCNVENASYPVGTCAERNAIAAAVREDGPRMRIAAVAVAARDRYDNVAPVIPCGACRQAIREFGDLTRVLFIDSDKRICSESIENLLPKSFTL